MSRDRWVTSLQYTTPSLAHRSRSFIYGTPCPIARAQGLALEPASPGQGLGETPDPPARHHSVNSAYSSHDSPPPHPSPHHETSNYSQDGGNGGDGTAGMSSYATPNRRTRRRSHLSDMLHTVASAVSHAMHTQVVAIIVVVLS